MGKEIPTQVQEAQRGAHRIHSKRNIPRHTLIKLTKVKHKNIKHSEGTARNNIQGNPHQVNS